MASHQPMLSIIAPVHNEQENLAELHRRLEAALEPITADYEIIFVDDGSVDDSVRVIEALAAGDSRTRLIELSRNFGKEPAMLAGYDHARGRAVIVVDSDLQTPPEVLPEMVSKWQQGSEIVDAIRSASVGRGYLRRQSSRVFYWVMRRLSNTEIIADAVDFRLLDRQVVDQLRSCRERFRFNRGLVSWVGFRRSSVTFVASGRSGGESGWGVRKLVSYAMDAIFSFSSLPLRLAGLVGLAISIFSFIYLAVLMVASVFFTQPMKGYATVVGGIFLLGGVQLVTIWLLGEYVGRLYDEAKHRRLYIVRRVVGSAGETAAAAAAQPEQDRASASPEEQGPA